MKLTPLIKGAITGVLMLVIVIAMNYAGEKAQIAAQYLVYGIYALGTFWAISAWSKTEAYTGKFGDAFQTGFRCFIMVTLIMVLFTAAFTKMHPEMATESAKMVKAELIKRGGMLPADIDKQAEQFKNNYTLLQVYGAVFGYLIIGAVVTAAVSFLITRRKT